MSRQLELWSQWEHWEPLPFPTAVNRDTPLRANAAHQRAEDDDRTLGRTPVLTTTRRSREVHRRLSQWVAGDRIGLAQTGQQTLSVFGMGI